MKLLNYQHVAEIKRMHETMKYEDIAEHFNGLGFTSPTGGRLGNTHISGFMIAHGHRIQAKRRTTKVGNQKELNLQPKIPRAVQEALEIASSNLSKELKVKYISQLDL